MIKKILRRIFLMCQLISDKIKGCDFAAPLDNEDIHVPRSAGNRYQATTPRIYHDLKQQLWHVSEADSILDVGCGKGRMLYFFSKQFDFGKVDGLEYSELLSGIAKQNMDKLKLPVTIHTGDAATFTALDYNYFYLFNTCPEQVMSRFVHNLCNHIDANPRKVTILYFNPVCRDCFLEHGFKIVSYKKGLMILTK